LKRRFTITNWCAVYQLAKLRMLQFYYDFIDKYIDRADFEMCQMDTDSNYIAFSEDNIEKLIKPHMRAEYEKINVIFYHQKARNYIQHFKLMEKDLPWPNISVLF
jgi:hypothetical protein